MPSSPYARGRGSLVLVLLALAAPLLAPPSVAAARPVPAHPRALSAASPAAPPSADTDTIAAHGTAHVLVAVGEGDVAAQFSVGIAAPKAAGYLTVYPDGTARPGTATLNFTKGLPARATTISRLSSSDKVAVYNGSSVAVSVGIGFDRFVDRAFVAGSATTPGSLIAINPARILDTGHGLGGSSPGPNGDVTLSVLGKGGLPASGVGEVALSVSAGRATASGYEITHAGGTPTPHASDLSFVPGAYVTDLVIAKVGSDGTVVLHNGSVGTVDLYADVLGWFAAGTPTAAGAFVATTPTRVLDTRGQSTQQSDSFALGTTPLPYAGVDAVDFTLSARGLGTGGDAGLAYENPQGVFGIEPITTFTSGRWSAGVGALGAEGGTMTIAHPGAQITVDVSGYFLADPATALGVIAGRVTSADGAPLAGVAVYLHTTPTQVDSDPTAEYDARTTTDADGRYAVFGVDPSTTGYFVCFDTGGAAGRPAGAAGGSSPTGYHSECNDNQAWDGESNVRWHVPTGATRVPVAHARLSTVNAVLQPGGSISGQVTDQATGGGLAATVRVYREFDSYPLRALTTDSSGRFRIDGLNPGSGYHVCFGTDTGNHQSTCWHDVPQFATQGAPANATGVRVTSGSVTSGINQPLGLAGTIAGTITYADNGQPDRYEAVRAFDETGQLADRAETDSAGHYTLADLPPAHRYTVCFGTGQYPVYAECYRGVPWPHPSDDGSSLPSGTTSVGVTAGAVTTGIDAQVHRAGGLTGYVSTTDSRPVQGAVVSVYDPTGTVVGTSTTQASGYWSVYELRPGPNAYRVCVDGSHATDFSMPPRTFGDRCYKAVTWDGTSAPPAGSATLTVAPAVAAANVDVQLPPT